MTDDQNDRSGDINISRIPVAGVAGLGLVIVVLAMAYEMPAIRGFLLLALAGGVLLTVPLFLWRKSHRGRR
jgi:hypothetical protein